MARVLIVDDNEHLLETLEYRFAERGHEVATAENGELGLQRLRSQHFDLVVSDFMMPELNGLELNRIIHSDPNLSSLKVLMMSHNSNPEFRKTAIEKGAVDYVLKSEGAKVIVERAAAILGPPQAPEPVAPPVQVGPSTHTVELNLLCERLVELTGIAASIDGVPAAAESVIRSAENVAKRIQELARAES